MDITIHSCPSCELRFVQLVELLSHLETDHPHEPPPAPPKKAGKLTVPVDPDRPLPVAIDIAAHLASQADLEIDLVASPGLASFEPTEAFLRERARLLRMRDHATVSWHVLPVEQPAVAINQHALESGTDLICLSTRASHGPRHFLFGSVAEAVVLGAELPVLMVGPHVERASGPFTTVIACLDGSPEADAALQVADRLRRQIGAELVLVEVVPPGLDLPGDTRESAVLVRAAHRVDGAPVDFEVLHSTDAGAALAAFADEHPDAIVVTGTHNRGGIRFTLGESVARDVVGRSRRPVLIIPPAADPDRFLAGHLESAET